MSIVVRADEQALAETFAEHFEAAAREAIAARGTFTCALTGGSAAKALYPLLVETTVDWTRVHLYFGDERAVPKWNTESNYYLAESTFLVPAAVPPENVHRMEAERPLEEAARDYEEKLPALDLVHLGMGPDGHVCSLFPGHPLLLERARKVAALTDSPKPPASRLTLTLPALAEARALWFLVLGAAKAKAARAAICDAACELPAARAHRAAHQSHWYLDAPAAAQLPPHPSL